MATQADFTSLEQLRLLDHGDAIERFYWPKVANSLSEYEVFWKRFVVLLTNRVDPLAYTDWIMLRDGVKPEYETLLMGNYSAFYHCVVAHEQIEIGRIVRGDPPQPIGKAHQPARRGDGGVKRLGHRHHIPAHQESQ